MAIDPFAGWMPAPNDLRLDSDEVHVWGWSLADTSSRYGESQRLESLLSEDELERMRRFRFTKDAARFVRARAGLREILGWYVSLAAEDVQFGYGEYGKPTMHEYRGGLHFNLSHTHDFAVAALSKAGPLGIDIEKCGPASLSLGEQAFSERELQVLKTLPCELFTRAFFTCWTRKEAISKAEGKGFHLPTQAFSVSVWPDVKACIEDAGGVLSRTWQLVDLPLGGSLVGSLAMCSTPSKVRLYQKP